MLAAIFVSTSPCGAGPTACRPQLRQHLDRGVVGMRAGRHVVEGCDHCVSPTRRNVTVRSPSCVGSRCRSRSSATGRREFPELLIHEASVLASSNLPATSENRVVGLVVLAVERLQPLDGHVLDVRTRADCRVAVVVPEVRGRQHALEEDARGEFSPDSNSLRTTVISLSRSLFAMKEFTMRSASRSSAQSRFCVGGGEGLEVVRAIGTGRAVRSCAVLGEFLRKVGMLGRSLEDEVLQQVRHPRLAVPLVRRADEVGDVDGDRVLRRIGEQQDLQAVRRRRYSVMPSTEVMRSTPVGTRARRPPAACRPGPPPGGLRWPRCGDQHECEERSQHGTL